MSRGVNQLRNLLFPSLPAAIRDDYILLTAAQLERNARLMFLALFMTTPAAYFAFAAGAPGLVSFAAPVIMGTVCLMIYLALLFKPRIKGNLQRSQRVLRDALWISLPLAVLCQVWCVTSWYAAPPDERIYYVFMLVLGALSSTYCLSGLRATALLNLAIGVLPTSLLLFTAGNRMDFAAGVSLGVAAVFQLRMIFDQHDLLVNQLLLQRRSAELAQTDPLTGLLNRRALLTNALEWGSEEWLRLIIVDIDHFKTINDDFGHSMGDEVLQEIGALLAARAEIRGSVARIGGEEFALLGTVDELTEGIALAILSDMRNARMPHGRQTTVSIGVAEGPVASEADWRDLYQRADLALYEAKRTGRNRLVHASECRAKEAKRLDDVA